MKIVNNVTMLVNLWYVMTTATKKHASCIVYHISLLSLVCIYL